MPRVPGFNSPAVRAYLRFINDQIAILIWIRFTVAISESSREKVKKKDKHKALTDEALLKDKR